MRRYALLLALLVLWAGPARADTCSSGACTLPCTATATPTQILPSEGRRVELVVCNQDTANTMYEVIGIPNIGPITPNYGIPVAPSTCVDLGVQPNTGTQQTVTQPITVITAGPTVVCSYLSKSN